MSERQQAERLYKSFRESTPRKISRVALKPPRYAVYVGKLDAIEYTTAHGNKVQPYRHKFARGSRPEFCVSADGKMLILLGGRFRFTERGIVDHDAKGRERPDPKHGRYVNPIERIEGGGHMITGDSIQLFQLLAVKGALKLESLGMKRRGGSLRKGWALKLGLPANTKYPALIAHIEKLIAEAAPKP